MRFIIIGLFVFIHCTSVTAEQKLVFGIYAADKATEVVRKFRPKLNKLEVKMTELLEEKVTIRMKVTKTYEQGVNDLVTGAVDFSRFGPASYITAKKQNPSIQLLALESNKGSNVFYGIICVHADSDITEIEDLKGCSFAFGSDQSTIGRFLSQLYLFEHNVTADKLSRYDYLGRHDKVGMAVALKKYDAGALKESTFKKLVKTNQPIRQLASFPNVTKPWIARSGLSEKLSNTLQKALFSLKGKDKKSKAFLPALDSDYDRIRNSIEGNAQFFKKTR